jgi:CspA family cold shock protein
MTGQVKWFSAPKGYGFIGQDNGDEDVFVHYSSITMDGFRKLLKGQLVEYTVEQGSKGLEAVDVECVD